MRTKIPELFLRYPGSKAKLYRYISAAFPYGVTPLYSSEVTTYCEPFFGSGAIGWRIMRQFRKGTIRVVINDRDIGIAALWKAVRDVPKDLTSLIENFEPTAEAFYEFKNRDGDLNRDTAIRGFEKLAIHQTSWSGLGYMAGGPLGGKTGRSEYNPECRWRPGRIALGISRCHRRMRSMASFEIHCGDFEPVLARLDSAAFAYLDPPYFDQGGALYKHSMSQDDHERLARVLRTAPYQWVLSYDDCEEIRDLYSWASVESFQMRASIANGDKRLRKNNELIIRPVEAVA